MKNVVRILLASHIYLLLMKSFNTCPSIGCSSYKFVSTVYVILANAIMISNSTLGDLSNYKSILIQSYFDTNITLFPYWKVSPKGNWLSILNPPFCQICGTPYKPFPNSTKYWYYPSSLSFVQLLLEKQLILHNHISISKRNQYSWL